MGIGSGQSAINTQQPAPLEFPDARRARGANAPGGEARTHNACGLGTATRSTRDDGPGLRQREGMQARYHCRCRVGPMWAADIRQCVVATTPIPSSTSPPVFQSSNAPLRRAVVQYRSVAHELVLVRHRLSPPPVQQRFDSIDGPQRPLFNLGCVQRYRTGGYHNWGLRQSHVRLERALAFDILLGFSLADWENSGRLHTLNLWSGRDNKGGLGLCIRASVRISAPTAAVPSQLYGLRLQVGLRVL